jgi:hypothetical protein
MWQVASPEQGNKMRSHDCDAKAKHSTWFGRVGAAGKVVVSTMVQQQQVVH